MSKIDAPDDPETASHPPENHRNPRKLQNFNSVNAKKCRILVKIVLPVEIEANKQIVSHLHTSMTRTFSKMGKLGQKSPKIRKNWRCTQL